MISLTREQARRFLVRRHLLAPSRSLPASPDSVLEVARKLGSLQFDPLDPTGARNHDLVLHARVSGYQRAWCDQWLYGEERRLFEVYNKSLNLVPVEELPFHRLAWMRAEARHRDGLLARGAKVARAVLQRIEREGSAASLAVAREHDAQLVGYWGAPTSEGRATLDALFETGRVGIVRRDGNRKHYDLIERLFPAELLATKVPRAECVRHRLLTRHRAVGLLGTGGSAELWVGIGTAAERKRALEQLVRQGVLVPVAVEGVRGERFVLADELPLLDEPFESQTATLIAPLDPLVWDRRLLVALFDFDYKWEIYTPIEQRRYGYYVLPILHGDRFVGRIEPRFDRDSATLTIAGVWFEPKVRLDAPLLHALTDALAAFARFVGAERAAFRGRSARALERALG